MKRGFLRFTPGPSMCSLAAARIRKLESNAARLPASLFSARCHRGVRQRSCDFSLGLCASLVLSHAPAAELKASRWQEVVLSSGRTTVLPLELISQASGHCHAATIIFSTTLYRLLPLLSKLLFFSDFRSEKTQVHDSFYFLILVRLQSHKGELFTLGWCR